MVEKINSPFGRPLYEIAAEIRRDWKQVHYSAAPYLEALGEMENASQAYGFDSGQSVVRYFLSNASTYRGPVAVRCKAELKQHCGIKLTKAEREALAL